MNESEYCKKVDEVLTAWLEVEMKGYTERQYKKGDIRALRDMNPVRDGVISMPKNNDED